MLAAFTLAPAFTPPGRMPQQSCDRREILSKVGGAAFALAGAAQGASAKAGQFGKQELFGFGSAPPAAARALTTTPVSLGRAEHHVGRGAPSEHSPRGTCGGACMAHGCVRRP